MVTNSHTTAVGIFSVSMHADRAIDALLAAGFTRESIGVIAPQDDHYRELSSRYQGVDAKTAGSGLGTGGVGHRSAVGTPTTGTASGDAVTTGDADTDSSVQGALVGSLTGAGIGGLIGLGVLSGVVPVIGPALVAGTLGTILSNAALGAGVAGLTGALIGSGFSEEDAVYYESELKSGRVIVTVDAGSRYEEAKTILTTNGGAEPNRANYAVGSGSAASTTRETGRGM